ncbi:MAG TPA: hypothetical protein VIY48_03105, partial [Candidatus Paceibacterota bacterium]
YCNANDPNDWSSEDGGGYIVFDGHYQIVGLAVWYDEIYVFCDNPKSVYRLTGDSPTEYVVKKLFDGVTAVNQDVIQNVGSDLIFADTNGVISLKTMVQYGDIEKSTISKQINASYVKPYTTQISGVSVEDNQYWMTVPSSADVVPYDVEIGAWTLYRFELGTSVTITGLGTVNGLTYIGTSDGHLYYLDYTVAKDNLVDFSLIARPAWFDFGTSLVKTLKFADVVLISSTGSESYDCDIHTDFNSVTPAKILSLVSLAMNGPYRSPYCGNINAVSVKFNQLRFRAYNIASGTGPHFLDRFVAEVNILSSYT